MKKSSILKKVLKQCKWNDMNLQDLFVDSIKELSIPCENLLGLSYFTHKKSEALLNKAFRLNSTPPTDIYNT
jgi:hypothetical protein